MIFKGAHSGTAGYEKAGAKLIGETGLLMSFMGDLSIYLAIATKWVPIRWLAVELHHRALYLSRNEKCY